MAKRKTYYCPTCLGFHRNVIIFNYRLTFHQDPAGAGDIMNDLLLKITLLLHQAQEEALEYYE